MKIAFILPVNGISGGLYVVYQHAHFLEARGHEVDLIFASTSHGLAVTSFPGFSLPTQSLHEARRAQKRYDLVIATWWATFYDLFSLNAERRAYFIQSDERRFYAAGDARIPWVELTYRYPGVARLTIARWMQQWLKTEFGSEASYTPNGIEPALFHPGAAAVAPRVPTRRVLIEGPGGVPFKRVDLAYRVADQVRARHPGLELWLVSSDGVVNPDWKFDRVFQRLALNEMPGVYSACDVLLKLSTVEGFFGPPLEMMTCGGTAIVGKVTGWDEYVVDGQNALAVELDAEAQAVAALERVIADSALLERLKQGGIQTAQKMGWASRSELFARALEDAPVNQETQASFLDRVRLQMFRGVRRLKQVVRP